MFNLGMPEILLLAFVGLLLFGSRLPEVGRNLGKSIVEFKKGLSGQDTDAPAAPPAPPVQPQQPAQLSQTPSATATPPQPASTTSQSHHQA